MKKVCDTLDVKEDLFYDEELADSTKRIENISRLQVLIVWLNAFP